LFDTPLSHSAPWQSQSKCNRDYVQSNRGDPVEDLVISIIILYRCNSDTATASGWPPILACSHTGLYFAWASQDRSRPISGATRAGLRAGISAVRGGGLPRRQTPARKAGPGGGGDARPTRPRLRRNVRWSVDHHLVGTNRVNPATPGKAH